MSVQYKPPKKVYWHMLEAQVFSEFKIYTDPLDMQHIILDMIFMGLRDAHMSCHSFCPHMTTYKT